MITNVCLTTSFGEKEFLLEKVKDQAAISFFLELQKANLATTCNNISIGHS